MQQRRWPDRLLAVLLWLPALVLAATSCPDGLGQPLPAGAELNALDAVLAAQAQACSRDPGYLAWHGAVLNALGRAQEAADRLERALLIAPGMMTARIDYAEALAALGDTRAARSLLAEVLARPDLPAAVAPALRRRYAELGRVWVGAARLSARAGYDSNLSSAPARDQLTLTLPDGELALHLADGYRARGGSTFQLEGSGELAHPLDQGATLLLSADSRWRYSPSVSGVDYSQLDLAASYLRPHAGGNDSFTFGTNLLNYDGRQFYTALRLSAARDWSLPVCRPQAGIDGEWRDYPQTPELDGRFVGLAVGLKCPERGASAMLRVGRDQARHLRAGGDQWRLDARLARSWVLPRGGVDGEIGYSWQQDDQSYSPLLAHGATRHINRYAARVEYGYPLVTGWHAVSVAELSRQRSNLDLFDINSHSFTIGVRRQW